jgi:hypothetical protein
MASLFRRESKEQASLPLCPRCQRRHAPAREPEAIGVATRPQPPVAIAADHLEPAESPQVEPSAAVAETSQAPAAGDPAVQITGTELVEPPVEVLPARSTTPAAGAAAAELVEPPVEEPAADPVGPGLSPG